jgi:hypothetical protein
VTSEAAFISPVPVPRIDHIMVLLDGPAHEAISQAAFLRERFARMKVKEADSSLAGQYSTLGIAGESTLIELFGPGNPSFGTLAGGLVFSFEEAGSAPAARAALDAHAEVSYHHDLIRRTPPGTDTEQPWYQMISVALGAGSPLLLFLNEVTPEYFRGIGARPGADGSLRRSAYLDATLGRADRPFLMQDVTGVTLSVSPERARRITDALTVFGYAVTECSGGWELCGHDLAIRLHVDELAAERITGIQLRLAPGSADSLPAREFRFGDTSRLVIEKDETAQWSFGCAGA